MIVAGYITPVTGILSSFVITYYWVYEYPIGICINLLSLLKAPGITPVILPERAIQEAENRAEDITRNLCTEPRMNNIICLLPYEYKVLIDKSLTAKLSLPLVHPGLVIFCLGYFASQVAFIVLAIIGIDNYAIGYIFYYILVVILGVSANFYVFAVAMWWIYVIIPVMISITLLYLLIFLWLIITTIVEYVPCLLY